jgi:PTS system mannose-specific IIA component
VKLAKIRGAEPLAEAVAHATAAGRKYIAAGSEVPDGPKAAPVAVQPAAKLNGRSS